MLRVLHRALFRVLLRALVPGSLRMLVSRAWLPAICRVFCSRANLKPSPLRLGRSYKIDLFNDNLGVNKSDTRQDVF